MESSRRDLLNDMAEHRSILKTNQNTHFSIIFQCLATSIESSRRDLLNDTAEHRPILKTNHKTHYSIIFQDRRMLSDINGKLSLRPFE